MVKTRKTTFAIYFYLIFVVLLITVFFDVSDIFATTNLTEDNILDIIQERYFKEFEKITKEIAKVAKNMLMVIFLFDLIWLGFNHITDNDFSGLFVGLLRAIIITGFGVYLLEKPEYIRAIVFGFYDLGENVGGEKLKGAGSFWELGVRIATKLSMHMELKKPSTWLFGFLGTFILWQFCKIAIYVLKVHIQCYALSAGGAIMLMFWGASFTRSYAQSYLQWLISVGMKFLFIVLLSNIAFRMLNSFMIQMLDAPSLTKLLAMFGAVGIFAGIMEEVPSMVDGLISGSGGSVGGKANLSTAPITNIAKSAVSGGSKAVQSAAGAAMSLKEASKLAKAQGKTGSAKWGAMGRNLQKAAKADIAGRLSGSVSSGGTMGGRMSSSMRADRHEMKGQKNSDKEGEGGDKPEPLSAPKADGSISAASGSGNGTSANNGGTKGADRLGDGAQGEAYFSGAPGDQSAMGTSSGGSTPASSEGITEQSSDDIPDWCKADIPFDDISGGSSMAVSSGGNTPAGSGGITEQSSDDIARIKNQEASRGKTMSAPGVKDDLARMKRTTQRLKTINSNKGNV